MIEMRICTKCDKEKPLEAGFQSNGRGGYRWDCKPCVSAYAKKYRARSGGGRGVRVAYRPSNKTRNQATCLSEMGPDKLFTGRTVRFFKETLADGGWWPPGSIWKIRGKIVIVWGTGADQYAAPYRGKV